MAAKRVPAAPILARLEVWVEQHHFTVRPDKEGGQMLAGGRELAEEVMGINYTAIVKRKSLSFDVADRILCKMGQHQAWYDDPVLSAIYWEIPLTHNPRELALLGDTKETQKRARHYARQRERKRLSKHEAMLVRVGDMDVLESEQVAA